MKRSIRFKLGLVIGILLMLLLVVGITAFFQTSYVNKKVNEIANVEHRTSETAYQMEINLMETGFAVLNYLHHGDTSQLEIIRKGELEFQKFQQKYAGLTQTRRMTELRGEVEKKHILFRKMADSLISMQNKQDSRTSEWNLEFDKLIKVLENETYEPEKRFDAHKDLKMRASLRVQAMKVNANKLRNNFDNYLRTGMNAYEEGIKKDQKEFLSNFKLQQVVARPERKEKFAYAINKSLKTLYGLTDTIISTEKQKREAQNFFEHVQTEFNMLLEEQVLILANRNLITSKNEALEAAERSTLIISILMFVTLLFGTITGIVFSRSLTRPLRQLVKATRFIARNDFSRRVDIHTKDELETLARSFNQMTNDLQIAKEKQEKLLVKIEKSNKDLEDFAHVVSHDLKAPLRGIHTLSEWLAAGYQDKLDKEGKEQLDLLRGRVKRMFDMINGILKYSKVGRTPERRERINLNSFIEETLQLLSVPPNIHIEIQKDLPEVIFEKIPLQQVFQNLLSNAIKYMDKPEGKIEIRCSEEGNFWKFSIFDNGPGIEERFLESIFKLFQTIKPKDELESTGVGLAIVQRIIENAGGRIWVESTPGLGSVFHFTLVKSPEI